MGFLENFFRRLVQSDNTIERHVKAGIKEMVNKAIDDDDEEALNAALNIYSSIRTELPALTPTPTPVAALPAEGESGVLTDEDTLRQYVINVMNGYSQQNVFNVSTYELFSGVDAEATRHGGWTERDLAICDWRRNCDRSNWREQLSRVLSSMKRSGELMNPSSRETRTYCLGPHLLQRLLSSSQQEQPPLTIPASISGWSEVQG